MNGEVAVLDRPTVPDGFDQRAFGNQSPRTIDQDAKHGDRASPNRHGLVASEQDLCLGVETELAKSINCRHRRTLRHRKISWFFQTSFMTFHECRVKL
jgi:hypothetical protein